jgi:hypothetical protein
MPWPTIFANLAAGNQPLALFDAMFTQVAQMCAIPTTAAGTNALTLTPIGSAPTFTSYQNFTSARFVAINSSTGNVTAQFGALAALNVYLADGVTRCTTGNIVAGQEYVLVFIQALNGGVGGFIIESAAIAAFAAGFAPNVQSLGTGSGVYTTPTVAGGRLPLYLHIKMSGSGGGGGAATTNNGSGGSTTTFNDWTANGGGGGANGGGGAASGGAGGSGGTNGAAGLLVVRQTGNGGCSGAHNATSGTYTGNAGGAGVFGGAGQGGGGAGASAGGNSGAGGAGGSNAAADGAGGGGAGEFVEFIYTTPAASYNYTVAGGGGGGSAGVQPGGSGGDGFIQVIAYWQ